MSDTPPPVDHSVLTSLLSVLGVGAPSAEADLVDTYLGELAKLLGQMREARAADDQVVLHRAAHTLQSSSANMGAMPLSGLCRALEDGATATIPADVDAHIAAIAAEVRRVEGALTARRHELDGIITGQG